MAKTDLVGLLTGIGSSPIDPTTAMTPRQAALQRGAQYGQGFRRSVGALTGADTRTNPEMAAVAMRGLDITDPEDQPKILQIVRKYSPEKEAQVTAAIGALAEKEKEKIYRGALVAKARALGLNDTADLVAGGAPTKAAEEQILEAEERNIISKQGRKGKAALARSKNAGSVVVESILKGQYDNMSDTLFLEHLRGEKAELKTFKQMVDGEETVRPFRVNESGQVYNASIDKWVNPVDLGLTQAPQVTKDISQANTFASRLTEGASNNFLELNEAARTAEEILTLNNRSKVLMDEGIKTGFGANFRLNTARLAKELGLVPMSLDDVAATEEFIAIRARQLMKLLPAFGSGSGISDRDVDIARGIAGGDVSLDQEALRRILYMEETLARDLIEKNNKSLERMMKITGEEMSPAVAEGFYISLPKREDYAIPPNAARYLQ